MSPASVRRAMMVFAAGLLAAAVVFAAQVSRPAHRQPAVPAGAGEALFNSRCAGCHTLDEVVRYERAALAPLLASHGDVSAAEAAEIVAYVSRRPPASF
jgi:mono/diheme cytochrome c family protein